MERRFSFNAVADLYDTARPDYPAAVFDELVAAAQLSNDSSILEVGCGTGQATADLARRGLQVIASDPGAELLAIAQKKLAGYPNVRLVNSTFEELKAEPQVFNLIVAAQSWHWVAPDIRFKKAALLLAHSGVLAVLGNVPVGISHPFSDELRRIYENHGVIYGPPPEVGYLPTGPFAQWFEESGVFSKVVHRNYPWMCSHSSKSYTDWLRTRSELRLLSEEDREALLQDVYRSMESHGGGCELKYETHLYYASRVG